ncbi:hypervirulence associated TUDOR domain-containing protein [Mucilaginibacter paludis]|uniref:Hypervirulence associated protein TUDOR domain-containing protein n=1 Tax=Mucilaginibacter paludis DSM 18603 TaxID=714943 RepID=H1Y6U3_9SPHI|nr:DUF2945 domain-containing protein [Mucilaginibacter paludis]EHQ28350.1 hypothetical protein Mucpa_4259 [Mucilaginibacter paludis DSM 18603]
MMKKGDPVNWKWGKSEAGGTIKQKFVEPVQKTIKGGKIKRNATKDKPAFLIAQENGDKVLKSESELKMGGKS